MPLAIDFYFSFRSPYSYLALPQVEAIAQRYEVAFQIRVVRPIALRIPGFFRQLNPLQPPYLMRDTARIAARLGIPYRWPVPDPVVMDFATGEVAEDQPYINRISRLGVAAAEQDHGLAFAAAAARAIWSGAVDHWHEGPHLADAARSAGLDLAVLDEQVAADPARFDAAMAANEAAQAEAGHWGVPLFVFEGEAFFGQDRLEDLLWHLARHGLQERAVLQPGVCAIEGPSLLEP